MTKTHIVSHLVKKKDQCLPSIILQLELNNSGTILTNYNCEILIKCIEKKCLF